MTIVTCIIIVYRSSLLQARKLRQEAKKKGLETHFVSRNLGKEIREEAENIDNISDDDEEETSDHVVDQSQGRRVKIKKKKVKKTSANKQARFRHTSYLGADLIYQHIDSLARQLDSLTVETIGLTGEGRDIKIVKINAADDQSDLPTIFIDAGIHAREWISPAATLYLIEKLARQIHKVS